MSNLLYCIGLPRSGKSTICTKWANEKPMRAIVNSDSIRLALTGRRYEPLAETQVFATKHVMIRALLERGFDVIVDGTHSTEISIQRILEIDINAQAVPFTKFGYGECVHRAVQTNQLDLKESIKRIYNNMIELGLYSSDLSEYVWDYTSLTLDGNKEMFPATRNFQKKIQAIKDMVQKRNLYRKFGETNG